MVHVIKGTVAAQRKHQAKSEVPSGHFKFKITGHFSGFNIDLIEFFRRIMPDDYYAKSTISSS